MLKAAKELVATIEKPEEVVMRTVMEVIPFLLFQKWCLTDNLQRAARSE